MTSSSRHFFRDLPSFGVFNDFANASHYQAFPSDWSLAITDIQHSTLAIEAGRYKDVNAMGVSSIVAVCNACQHASNQEGNESRNKVNLPFVFGGDGATIAFHNEYRQVVKEALMQCQYIAESQFQLTLRIGIVPIQDLYAQNHMIAVAKFQHNNNSKKADSITPQREHHGSSQAFFRGSGVSAAEALLKQDTNDNPYQINEKSNHMNADLFAGFECRWNEIPSASDENVSLLIQANDINSDAIYHRVHQFIIECYGSEQQYNPLLAKYLRLTWSPLALWNEAVLHTAGTSNWQLWVYIARTWLQLLAGRFFINNQVNTDHTDWGKYPQRLIEQTDYRKFDNTLRMILAGTEKQRQKLENKLKQWQHEGKLTYGLHVADSALVTCLISDYQYEHIHFLDGNHGGYAIAAKMLKEAQSARINRQ